jgi:hypothetical protein
VNAKQGFREFQAARQTIQGYQAIHMIRKRQVRWVAGGDLLRQVTRHRLWLRWFHIVSVVWGIWVEAGPWPCPLTLFEQWLETRAGLTAYQGSFMVHYLEAVIYPDVPQALLTWLGPMVCVAILAIHGRSFWLERHSRSQLS